MAGARSAVHPVEPGRLEFFLDAGAGDQAAVADQHHPLQPEAVLDLGNLTGERGRIGGIAFEHLDRDRTAVGGAQQPDDDLRLVAPTVAAVAEARQRAAAALEIARGEIVEDEATVLEMAPGERLLDRRLSPAQPVERRVDLLGGDHAQPEGRAE